MTPSAESWALFDSVNVDNSLHADTARWRQKWSGNMSNLQATLVDGKELQLVPGVESFPSAIISFDADGNYEIIIATSKFRRLYPDGPPLIKLKERSNRDNIERIRKLTNTRSELVEKFISQGMSEGEALLRAGDELEQLGLLPKSPKLVAARVGETPTNAPLFDIPDEYLTAGMFQDIDAAVRHPGTEVDTGTGTYLQYYDDDLGPRLKAYREAGNDTFFVRAQNQLYKLTVLRFDDSQQAD